MASRAAGSRLLVGCRTPGVGNLFLVLLAVLLLSSCASYQARDRFPSVRTDDGTQCSRFYEKMAGATAPVRDARYHAIPGLPWLRTSRFLSGFSDRQDSQVVRALLREQNRLARESLMLEWGNLSQTDRAAADFPSNNIEHTLTLCGERLNTALLRDREALRSWRANMAVPDDYHTLWRVAGLYPLVAPVFRQAVAVEQREADRLAAGLLNQLRRRPADFRLYTWPAPVTEQSPLSTATRNALGQAQLSAVEREALLARHAPRWWVKTGSGDDRIGTVELGADGEPRVDTERPALYTTITWGRYRGETTVQLNYMVWFPAIPAEGPLDLVAGKLDSLLWRVHLDREGQVLAYDSVHGCGCWYKFWPGAGRRADPPRGLYTEPVWTGEPLPAGRPDLLVSAGRHQLAVAPAEPSADGVAASALTRFDYRRLRTLASDDGRASLFEPSGLVPESRRPERWLFWPMGIPSPGATRVLGHHAIAFVGRRHFDEPDLLENLGLQRRNSAAGRVRSGSPSNTSP